MKLRAAVVIGLPLAILLAPTTARACKYNVRDVAFVDLGGTVYRLEVIVKKDHPLRRAIQDAMLAMLSGGNVQGRVLDPDGDAARVAELVFVTSRLGHPLAFLVTSDERRLPLFLASPEGRVDEDSVWSAMTRVLVSPARTEIHDHLLSAHSVVLVVESSDERANERAHAIAAGASARVSESLDRLPKPLERGPRVVVVTAENRPSERILLWGLGIEESDRDAQIVVLMGRARRVGPVLTVPGATTSDLLRHLTVVGQDCECGLDRSWMQGPMIPHEWSTEDEARAVKALGFDPGSPMVKTEISRILARGASGAAPERAPAPDPLLSYREIDLESLAPEELPAVSLLEFVWTTLWLLAAVALGAGAAVFWRRRRAA